MLALGNELSPEEFMIRRAKHFARRIIETVAYRGDKTIAIKDIKLTVDYSERGGRRYKARSSHEEYVSPIYLEIASALDPKLIVDVGANYGFTGLIFAKKFPDAHLVLVEPSPKLCHYIEMNMRANRVKSYTLIPSICGASDDLETSFSLNPASSQDNRVIGKKGWPSIPVTTRSLGGILEQHYKSGNIFIKIDTQGFEGQVLRGANSFLQSNQNWLIKSEFAPNWLESQGTNALALLRQLLADYSVTEMPARVRFNEGALEQLFVNPLQDTQARSFVEYVRSLNGDGLGWCDLLIKPKTDSRKLAIGLPRPDTWRAQHS